MNTLLKGAVLALCLLIALPFLFARFLGRKFIYHPTQLTDSQVRSLANNGWRYSPIAVNKAIVLKGLVRPPTAQQKRWLLLFGGNATDLAANRALLDMIRRDEDLGLATFAYRGYDSSTGEPSEEALVGDAHRAVRHLEERFAVPPERLIIIGYSLGSGVATQLAAQLSQQKRAPDRLILCAPYRSIARLFSEAVPVLPLGWVAPDRYNSEGAITSVQSPVLLLHGTQDLVIPVDNGRALQKRLKSAGKQVELIEYSDRGHDLFHDQRPAKAILEFVRPAGP